MEASRGPNRAGLTGSLSMSLSPSVILCEFPPIFLLPLPKMVQSRQLCLSKDKKCELGSNFRMKAEKNFTAASRGIFLIKLLSHNVASIFKTSTGLLSPKNKAYAHSIFQSASAPVLSRSIPPPSPPSTQFCP